MSKLSSVYAMPKDVVPLTLDCKMVSFPSRYDVPPTRIPRNTYVHGNCVGLLRHHYFTQVELRKVRFISFSQRTISLATHVYFAKHREHRLQMFEKLLLGRELGKTFTGEILVVIVIC